MFRLVFSFFGSIFALLTLGCALFAIIITAVFYAYDPASAIDYDRATAATDCQPDAVYSLGAAREVQIEGRSWNCPFAAS